MAKPVELQKWFKDMLAGGVLKKTLASGATEADVANSYRLLGPRWDHDCDVCVFLGRYGAADLYFCKGASWPTVIARFSSDPPDYASGWPIAESEPFPGACHRELRVAYLIARDCGLGREKQR